MNAGNGDVVYGRIADGSGVRCQRDGDFLPIWCGAAPVAVRITFLKSNQ